MAGNSSLGAAKVAKVDEFYTQLSDIESELRHYRGHFRGKTVLCNCDDPRVSNFFKYFALNFELLGLKRLIATCYKNNEPDLFSQHECEQAVYIIYEGDKNGNKVPDPSEMEVMALQGDGDFRSAECIDLLKQADIVCTNPPFSLFREYIGQLYQYNKKFIIIGNMNAISYKEVFPLIKGNQLWLGYNNVKQFMRPDGTFQQFGNVCWFTNLEISKRHEELILYKRYKKDEYLHYENYDAIEVPKLSDIPMDYDGIMGVSLSFLEVYNPEQFEIIGSNCSTELVKELGVKRLGEDWIRRYRAAGGTGHNTANMVRLVYNDWDGKPKVAYFRLLIRKRTTQ